MSIKTNELQQMTSILGADSLLADAAAAGTGRVSAAALAQFMDQELLKPGTALSTALSNKAALSTQNTVEATTVPIRTVEVAAADLPAYIAGLPRLLMDHLTIKVSGDVTSGTDLDLSGFYGGGSLHLVQTDSNAVCSSQLNISHNHILIEIMNFHFVDPNPGSQSARIGVYAANGSLVAIKGCTFSSSAAAESQKYTAVEAYNFADICLENVKASGCGKVVSAGSVCVICVWSARAEDLHDNGVGAHVWYGGTVIIGSGMPDTLGGTSNAKNGGMIVKSDGTLL